MSAAAIDRGRLRAMLARARALWSKLLLNAAGTVVGQLVAIAAVPLQLHALGAEQYGVLVLYASLVTAGSVVDAGIGPTTLRFVARAAERPQLLRHVLASSRTMVLLIAVGITVIGQAIAATIVALRGAGGVGGTNIYLMCLLITIGIGLSMLTSVNINALRGLRRYRYFAICETSYRIIQPLALVVLAVTTRAVEAVLIGNCVVSAIFAGVMTVLVARETGVAVQLTTNLRYFRRHMSKFSLWVWAQAIFGYLGGQADRFVVVSFMSLSALSMYAIALQVASVMLTMVTAAGGFLMPEAANRLRDPEWLRRSYRRYTQFFSAASSIAIICALPFVPTVLQLWLGKATASQVLPFVLPLFWVAASTITSIPATQIMNAMGFVRLGAVMGTISNGILLIVMVLAGWQFGVIGIICAKLLALPFGFITRMITSRVVFRADNPFRFTIGMVWPTLLGAAVTLAFFHTPLPR